MISLSLEGLDQYHPAETAREIARLAPAAELVERWKDSPELIEEASPFTQCKSQQQSQQASDLKRIAVEWCSWN